MVKATRQIDPEAATEAWLDSLDPATTPARDGRHLRAIGAALDECERADAELHRAVAAARAAGDSWGAIGTVLGTSKQGAQQRFGRRVVEPVRVQD